MTETKTKTKKTGYSDYVKNRAITKYKYGVPIATICDSFGISSYTLYHWLRKYDIPLRGQSSK